MSDELPVSDGVPILPDPVVGKRPPLPGGNPRQSGFTPEVLDRTVISIPLLREMRREALRRERHARAGLPRPRSRLYAVVIDLNLDFHGGRAGARERIVQLEREAAGIASDWRWPYEPAPDRVRPGIAVTKSAYSHQYLFACLEGDVIREMVALEASRDPRDRAIFRVWPDFPVRSLITRSLSTVKADAARISFSALGENIVWAVLDSGIDGGHPHFALHGNLELPAPLQHRDFTGASDAAMAASAGPPPADGRDASALEALADAFGHGTHVAGIVAGEWRAAPGEPPLRAVTRQRDEAGNVTYASTDVTAISGMAPRCKLVSYKVLNGRGRGRASNLIAALEHIQEINGYGRRLLIHGVNMSVGYDFEPEWFACGQSPLCVEVDRLVRSGVSVVVAAGNTGYGQQATAFRGTVSAGLPLSINDPGNAELAVTVGSTHRDSPHVYGVSYFSSKGPTGDGRLKPDLVAPGEKIVSCAAGTRLSGLRDNGQDGAYLEESGTSMAAPHVSGVVAAFLSVRREFVGRPEAVKEIFLTTATDLKRDRYFQGHGLVDLMRAIQSI